MRTGEFGFTIRVNTDFDLSGNTLLTLNVTHPDTSTGSHTMTLGTTDLVVDSLGTFKANEYAEYIVQENDLTQVGTHTVSVTADFGSAQRLKSAVGVFEMTA